jgi:hypothetical protein
MHRHSGEPSLRTEQLIAQEGAKQLTVTSSVQLRSLYVILGFRREVDENCAPLGYYAASSGNSVTTFRDNLSVPSHLLQGSRIILEDGVGRLSRNVGKELTLFWVKTNLMHSFLMYLFLCLYMFRAASAHHQEGQIVLIHHLV